MLMLLIVLLVLPWIRVQAQQCRIAYSVNHVKLQGHLINHLSTPESFQCVDKCALHEHCNSINFYQDKGMCELNNATHLTNPESMVSSNGSQYLNYFLRPAANCSNKLCSKPRDKCVMDSDGLNYKCVNMSTCPGNNLKSNRNKLSIFHVFIYNERLLLPSAIEILIYLQKPISRQTKLR